MKSPRIHLMRRTSKQSLRRLRLAVRRAISTATEFRQRRFGMRGRKLTEAQLALHWEWIIVSLLRFGGASSGNAVQLYCDGDALLEDLWASLDAATSQIWVEMYTIQPDRVGKRTLEAMAKAAQRGCDVKLMVD